jgi:hypothetical protein
MVQKTIGFYNDTLPYSPFNEDTLLVEIGAGHFACLVKQAKTNTITSFELFTISLEETDWDDVFYEVRTNSGLLDKSYSKTNIFYNLPSYSLVPSYKYTEANADLFLQLIHGDDASAVLAHDVMSQEVDFVVAYRVQKQLQETVNRNFLNTQTQHVCSSLLHKVLEEEKTKKSLLLQVQFYQDFFIATVCRSGKLQLVQHFAFTTPEDVLYTLLNIVSKLELVGVSLVLSGFIDLNSTTYQYLQQNFTDIYLDEVLVEDDFREKMGNHPLHYFSPFFNLRA